MADQASSPTGNRIFCRATANLATSEVRIDAPAAGMISDFVNLMGVSQSTDLIHANITTPAYILKVKRKVSSPESSALRGVARYFAPVPVGPEDPKYTEIHARYVLRGDNPNYVFDHSSAVKIVCLVWRPDLNLGDHYRMRKTRVSGEWLTVGPDPTVWGISI